MSEVLPGAEKPAPNQRKRNVALVVGAAVLLLVVVVIAFVARSSSSEGDDERVIAITDYSALSTLFVQTDPTLFCRDGAGLAGEPLPQDIIKDHVGDMPDSIKIPYLKLIEDLERAERDCETSSADVAADLELLVDDAHAAERAINTRCDRGSAGQTILCK